MEIFDQLNEEQKKAVEFVEGPLLVLAGAGSGKTRVVTYRIANLLQKKVPPQKILGLTFTNKAAGEMKERIEALTKSHVLICTFHSLGARILRESIGVLGYKKDFTIYDDDDTDRLIKTCLQDLNIKDKAAEPKAFKSMISKAKNSLISPDAINKDDYTNKLEQFFPSVYSLYQDKLKQYNALDFDDLLYLPVMMFHEFPEVLEFYQNRWHFLLIDEYQDTNEAQYELVQLLVAKRKNLFVVGDPDQSIYSWRGANIRNIMNFERDYPGATIVRLEQNYRSKSNILEAANALIKNNDNRYEKSLWSNLGAGELIKYYSADGDKAEAEFVAEKIRFYHEQQHIPYNQMVIFYRTNSQSRSFEDRFFLKRIPYVIVGGLSFYQRREIKDILSYLRIIYSGADYISFVRSINLPKRGIGDATLDKLRNFSELEQRSIFGYCQALVKLDFLHHSLKLNVKQFEGLKGYVELVERLKKISHESNLSTLVKETIQLTGYLDYIKEDLETFEDRKANLDALIAKAVEWEATVTDPSLGSFLEELSLKSTLDEVNGNNERVNLMTIHNGKGLEFTLTFLVGLEEELFPHANARDNHAAIEEERRLCYVGMTRAKEYLYITNSKHRFMWGTPKIQRPSRFLKEIPSEYVEKVNSYDEYPYRQKPTFKPHYTEKQEESVEEKPSSAKWARVSFSSFTEKTSIEPDQTIYKEGDTIFHKEFGIGLMKQVYQGSMGLTYKILFSNDGKERTLIAKFAKLKKL
ncbi:ATP-dependent DNA helicase PcrA [Candidatus Rubidus massiliensis]|nr:ATP-dependent DNA helicase PcrA [Candidatus Rubidus massiliensis]